MPALHILLDRLEDPFTIFPLQDVTARLGELVEATEEWSAGRADWWGGCYPSVEQKHGEEVVELLVGAAFVLGQAAISQAISIVAKLSEEVGRPAWLPQNKIAVMEEQAPRHQASGESEIALIDALANYSKHRFEWPDDWSIGGSPVQRRAIALVSKLGLSAGATNNLQVAARQLGMSLRDMSAIGTTVQTWREGLARSFRVLLARHGSVVR